MIKNKSGFIKILSNYEMEIVKCYSGRFICGCCKF